MKNIQLNNLGFIYRYTINEEDNDYTCCCGNDMIDIDEYLYCTGCNVIIDIGCLYSNEVMYRNTYNIHYINRWKYQEKIYDGMPQFENFKECQTLFNEIEIISLHCPENGAFLSDICDLKKKEILYGFIDINKLIFIIMLLNLQLPLDKENINRVLDCYFNIIGTPYVITEQYYNTFLHTHKYFMKIPSNYQLCNNVLNYTFDDIKTILPQYGYNIS